MVDMYGAGAGPCASCQRPNIEQSFSYKYTHAQGLRNLHVDSGGLRISPDGMANWAVWSASIGARTAKLRGVCCLSVYFAVEV